MRRLALLAMLACHRRPASPVDDLAGPGAAGEAVAAPVSRVVGPGIYGDGRFSVPVPAGFTATAETGWLVAIAHAETGAVLRVGGGAPRTVHPGFLQVFSDDGAYRSGPGGALAATETWISLAIGGPTRRVLHAGDLHVELEIPLHAEMPAWAAFEPIIAELSAPR